MGEVRSGAPRFVSVEGAAGIGKTALVNEFLAGERDLTVLRAGGDEEESGLAYGVLDQLLRFAGDAAPAVLSSADPAAWVPDHVSAGLRLLQALGALEERGPLAVVVDDAHLSDSGSLKALVFAVRRLVADTVLVVVIARESDAPLPQAIRQLAAGATGTRLRLGPLAVDDIRRLAELAGVPISRPAAKRLEEHTGGNPSHVRALLEELPTETWQDPELALPAPRTVARALADRLGACDPPVRRLVEAIAVLGRRCPLAAAARLAELEDPLPAVEQAAAAGFVRVLDRPGSPEVAFPDPLVGAAVDQALGAVERARLHARAAELADDEASALRHRVAAAAGADPELAAALDAFAEREASRGSWQRAAGAFAAASRLSASTGDRERRLLSSVEALLFGGEIERARHLAAPLRDVAPGPRRDAVLAHLTLLGPRPLDAEPLLLRAWEACDHTRDARLAAGIARSMANHCVRRLRGREAVMWSDRAIALAAPGDPARVHAEGLRALGLAFMGEIAGAERWVREALADLSEENGLPLEVTLGWLRLAQDDLVESRERFARAEAANLRLASFDLAVLALAQHARADFAAGDWDDAVLHAERAVAIAPDLEHLRTTVFVRWAAVLVPAARGHWNIADAQARLAVDAPGATEGERAAAAIARAIPAAARADHAGVLRALQPLVAPDVTAGADEPGFWPWHGAYADALVAVGALDDAAAFLPAHEARAGDRGLHSALARLGRARGRLEAARGEVARAAASLQAAVEHAEAAGMPFERALGELAHGQLLRRQGRRAAAAERLRSARDVFAALDALPSAERCDQELVACGLAPARRGEAGSSRLTPQERSVARLVASGMTNRQVAAELIVSVKTVEVHLTRIYRKLGVSSRAQLIAHAHEML